MTRCSPSIGPLVVGLLLASSPVEARVVCPTGFSRSDARCVQKDCIAAGGIYDHEMRCSCGANKACTKPVTYTRRARAKCKDACPEERITACVPQGQPCPGERATPCKQDSDCPSCAYCKAGKCAQATALIATSAPAAKKRGRKVGWRQSGVTFWPDKGWIAELLWMRGCRLVFRDVEDFEELADLLAQDNVKALAYFGHCTPAALKKKTVAKASPGGSEIFGKRQPTATTTHYLPTIAGVTADELNEEVTAVVQERLTDTYRREGAKRAAAKKKAAAAAKQMTQNGWLHYLLNSTCFSLNDNSMPDRLVRPGGVYWGRKGTPHVGVPMTRFEKPD